MNNATQGTGNLLGGNLDGLYNRTMEKIWKENEAQRIANEQYKQNSENYQQIQNLHTLIREVCKEIDALKNPLPKRNDL